MSSQPKKILLVDDEERLLAGLRRRLSTSFEILTATSGPEALALIGRDPEIAVIVADMQMPEMNGIELLKAVQEKAPAIRRLMLTGNSDMETAVSAINEGKVMRFLRKPCDAEDLKAALSQALAEHAFQTTDDIEGAASAQARDSGAKAREAFLSMMNHELRTPLNHIIGLAGLLEESSVSGGEPSSLEHLQQIQTSGRQMLALVSRILEFSRLKSISSDHVEPETANIVRIINDEVASARTAAEQKAITISIDSLRRRVDVPAQDADIRLAIKELLANAIKFNAANGHISILVKCDNNSVAVKIFDTGCGVPDNLVDIIRQPFRQGDESYSRTFEGVGLGLALVSTVAELNNVRFSIAPLAEGGSEVTLVFNRAAPAARELPAAASA
ncbi:MAG: hybrid sensor histidine kinase/response regulator [Pseudomonadota bacterium]